MINLEKRKNEIKDLIFGLNSYPHLSKEKKDSVFEKWAKNNCLNQLLSYDEYGYSYDEIKKLAVEILAHKTGMITVDDYDIEKQVYKSFMRVLAFGGNIVLSGDEFKIKLNQFMLLYTSYLALESSLMVTDFDIFFSNQKK